MLGLRLRSNVRRAAWAALALAAQACAASPSAPTTSESTVVPVAEPPSITPAHRFSLVWIDAPLYRYEGDSDPLRSHDLDAPREQRPGYAYVAAVLEIKGAWRRLGGVDTWLQNGRPLHCSGNELFPSDGLGLEVWVHEKDLVPVLNQPLQTRFEDGTSLDLNPGAPVVGGRVWAGGFWFPGAVDTALVGFDYTPVSPKPGPTDELFEKIPRLVVRLGGELVERTPQPWLHPDGLGDTYPVQDGLLLGTSCGAFALRAEGEPAENKTAGILGTLRGRGETVAAGEVAAGTPLYWEDGHRAGQVAAESVTRADLQPGDGPRTCFPVAVGTRVAVGARFREERPLLCVDTADVRATTVDQSPFS